MSLSLSSHLGSLSFGFCLTSVCLLTKKERQRVQQEKKKKGESRDVLIKGNSEGLDQIILRNLVREDTVFDSEKMKMMCP